MPTPLIPGFMIAGFECSTPINRDTRRVDELAMTQHDCLVEEDYRLLRKHGIRSARDGIRWNLVDSEGRINLETAIPFIDAAEHQGIHVIWDLFHYGYPSDLDPFTDEFIARFSDYCYAVARLVSAHSNSVPFFTPVNEISYFAWAGGDQGIFAPHFTGRGPELKRQLARASISGMDAILAVDPRARFVHCEPMVHVAPPLDAPQLADEAEHFNDRCVFEAWDMLGGLLEPELGGSPRHLDIIGVNYYGYNQWEHTRPDCVLAIDDPRRVSFADLLDQVYRRYRRPMIVSETSSHGDLRPSWLRYIGDQCVKAINKGVDLHGLCLYPIIDMFDWHATYDHTPLHMGLFELCRGADRGEGGVGRFERVPHDPTVAELKRFQSRLVEILPHLCADTERRPRKIK